ncbi:uncharacterized protein LACBIDRAFT_302127 [Laccaria bicolor S238N-H82]|uniref:Predicted protein n=1 Tax=Laccaria bicolor (strain S238N-H82 / ATCC MYA-4686) TaxID=486041 RepID=B0DH46_LACBS|nr:uncharacterized protein LACBIDRAFT_302127 [Laccaria bicolor S238N-H82]EDR05949.1 predicted protein [Laccaria bicolor S238N-H82]|eukprot:XP_001883237.1 predicted protein [Laccaria bicolor S238N-H82]
MPISHILSGCAISHQPQSLADSARLHNQVTSTDHPGNKRYGGLSSVLITPSSTIGAEDIAMPATSDLFEVPGEGEIECSQQVLPISTGLVSVGAEMTVACEGYHSICSL